MRRSFANIAWGFSLNETNRYSSTLRSVRLACLLFNNDQEFLGNDYLRIF